MTAPQSLPVVECSRIGIFPNSTRARVIGYNFCYNWQLVQAAAQKRGCNLDAFFTAPLAKRLTVKQLKTPVTFWFTPLGKFFVITVCCPKKVSFFDPLHGMRGYVEYGGDYLRPTARPFLQWDGSRVIRIHALEARLESPFLVADFGNNFGLTVSESDEEIYRQIQDDPAGHFEYTAVPSTSPITIMRTSEEFEVHHALCISH
jgi:hypothetical protein